MKRKLLAVLLALCLLLACSVSVYAESSGSVPSAGDYPDLGFPIITKDLQDTAAEADTTLHLSIEAVSPDAGTLSYQWYFSYSPRESALNMMPGETSNSLTVDLNFVGIIYYCCGVWNNLDSYSCGPTYSKIARVYVVEHLEDLDTTKVEIQCRPENTIYNKGDELNLKGLCVWVYNGLGFKEYRDGEGVSVTGYDKDRVGKQTLTVSFDGKSDTFEVTVNDTAPQSGGDSQSGNSPAEDPAGNGGSGETPSGGNNGSGETPSGGNNGSGSSGNNGSNGSSANNSSGNSANSGNSGSSANSGNNGSPGTGKTDSSKGDSTGKDKENGDSSPAGNGAASGKTPPENDASEDIPPAENTDPEGTKTADGDVSGQQQTGESAEPTDAADNSAADEQPGTAQKKTGAISSLLWIPAIPLVLVIAAVAIASANRKTGGSSNRHYKNKR